MDNGSPPEIQLEPDLEPVVCPFCAAEIDHEPWPQVCPNCRRPIDLQAQFAYCRGHNAFTVGQELVVKAYRGKKPKYVAIAKENEGLQYYLQAFTALQRAFQGRLAESQRQLGIRMMAAIAQVLQHNTMISPLEATYWNTLLTELNAQQEMAALKEKLAGDQNRSLVHIPKRWRWHNRQHQLEKGLDTLNNKLNVLEHQIGFTEKINPRQRANEPVRQRL